jgi:ribosome biogenesis protein Nip4
MARRNARLFYLQIEKKETQIMSTKAITDFASHFGVQIALNLDLIAEKTGRFYLVNPALKPLVREDFFSAGVYLGKAKGGKFFPSFYLLGMLAKKEANRIFLDKKSAWLFICGRDILRGSIVRIQGPGKKNTNILVFNEFGECLGFGRIVEKLRESIVCNGIVVRNVLDIGDFLRRER